MGMDFTNGTDKDVLNYLNANNLNRPISIKLLFARARKTRAGPASLSTTVAQTTGYSLSLPQHHVVLCLLS